jgi:hypothetical protein
MATDPKLEAARRTGDLHTVIGVLREQAATETPDTSAREQVGVEDGAIRLAAQLSAQGTTGAERRQALNGAQVGTSVSGRGVSRTVLSPEAKRARALEWAGTLSEDQRGAFLISEKFDELPEGAQIAISEAFAEADDDGYQASITPDLSNLDAELVDVDAIVDADGDEAEDDAEHEFELLEPDPWEGDIV